MVSASVSDLPSLLMVTGDDLSAYCRYESLDRTRAFLLLCSIVSLVFPHSHIGNGTLNPFSRNPISTFGTFEDGIPKL